MSAAVLVVLGLLLVYLFAPPRLRYRSRYDIRPRNAWGCTVTGPAWLFILLVVAAAGCAILVAL